MALVEDNGKVRKRVTISASEEFPHTFDEKGRVIRITKFRLLHDYATGADKVTDSLHKGGLVDAVRDYENARGFRGGLGVRLNLTGFSSSFKRDQRFDNEQLALRRIKNVFDFLKDKGVAREDLSDLAVEVREDPKNLGVHRSTQVAQGVCANDKFKAVWRTRDRRGVGPDFENDRIEIFDMQWKLAATYRLALQGNDAPGAPLPAQNLDLRELDLVMGSGGLADGLPALRNNVPLTAFHFAAVTFKTIGAAGLTQMSGVTPHEQVPFSGTMTDPTANRTSAPRPDDERKFVMILAKPTLDPIF